MGLVTGALQIGRSALMAYQSALEVVGNNISNVATDGYTRQTPILSPTGGLTLPEGFQPGGGVALTGLQRNVDQSIEDRYRIATGDQAAAQVRQDTLNGIESSMNELSGSDLSTLLQNFFNAFSTLQNEPTDAASRSMVLTAGDALVGDIQRQRTDVLASRDQLNQQLQTEVGQANQLAGDIANLNVQISAAQSTGKGGSNALSDQRDRLLRQLGEMMQIQVREQPGGSVNVYVGNEPLVQGGLNRGLTTTLDTRNQNPRVIVQFADNNSTVDIRGGKLAGLIDSRDNILSGQIDHLDSLSRTLINEVNKVHSQGQGLDGFTDTTGTYDVLNADAALDSTAAGLEFKPNNGSFKITVTDENTGLSQDFVVPVDLGGTGTDDSLRSLVGKINGAVLNAHAEVTGDNRLRFTADSGYQITFSEDSSNLLASLGVNTFFTGHSSQDLGINPDLSANVNLLAAATQNTTGDGSNAARIAALNNNPISSLGNQSISGFYNAIVSDVAVKGAAAKSTADATASVTSALASQRESISGVNLDEETVSLLKLERAFEGAARYTTTVNGLIDQLLAIVR